MTSLCNFIRCTIPISILALSSCFNPVVKEIRDDEARRVRTLDDLIECKLPMEVKHFKIEIAQSKGNFVDRPELRFLGVAKVDSVNCEFWIDSAQNVQDIFIRDRKYRTREGFKIGDTYAEIKDSLNHNDIVCRLGTYRAIRIYNNFWAGMSLEPANIMDSNVVIEYFFKSSGL